MGISTSAVSNSMGVVNEAINVFATDAVAAVDTTFNFGFRPRKLEFINLTDRLTHEVFDGMTSGYMLKTIAAGTRTLEVAGGPVINADGTVTVPAALMVASKSFVFVARG